MHAPQAFSGAYYKLDDSVHQELVACVVFRLVGMFLEADAMLAGCVQGGG